MIEKIKQNAERIAGIIKDTESIQKDEYESAYRKEQALISAYVEIVELVGGDQE